MSARNKEGEEDRGEAGLLNSIISPFPLKLCRVQQTKGGFIITGEKRVKKKQGGMNYFNKGSD